MRTRQLAALKAWNDPGGGSADRVTFPRGLPAFRTRLTLVKAAFSALDDKASSVVLHLMVASVAIAARVKLLPATDRNPTTLATAEFGVLEQGRIGSPGRSARSPDAADVRAAQASGMSHDTLIHQAVRPAVRAIAGTWVTPNHLTALRLVTGLAAAASFAFCCGEGWMALGAGLFLFSALLDRADGELARQTRRFSRYGHRWDLAADCTCTAAAFVGLGFGAAGGSLGQGSVVLGILAGIGIGSLFWQMNVARSGSLPGYTGSDGRVLADPDDALLAVPLILWCAGAGTVLVLAGVLAPAAALWMHMSGRRLRSMVSSPRPASLASDLVRSVSDGRQSLAKPRR